MPRIPLSWRGKVANLAGANRALYTSAVQRAPVTPPHLYVNQVTVDLGNDGMAPNATFTAGGTAQAFIGPSSGGDLWSLDQCFLSTSVGQLDVAQCSVFAGPLPLAQYAVTASPAGGSSQFGMGGVGVPFGWFIWALWTGGTPGAIANLRVTGTKTVLTN